MLGSVIVTLTHGHADDEKDDDDDDEDEINLNLSNYFVPARPKAHPHSEGPRRE